MSQSGKGDDCVGVVEGVEGVEGGRAVPLVTVAVADEFLNSFNKSCVCA